MDYNKLLEKARKTYSECVTDAEKRRLESIFPELAKKSEDEKVKNAIIHILNKNYTDVIVVEGVKVAEIVAWLKKQGEKKSVIDDYTKTNLDRAIQIINEAKGNLVGYQTDDGIYECDEAIKTLKRILNCEFETIKQDVSNRKEGFEYNGCIWRLNESVTIEHGKYYYCVQDFYSGGRKRASKGDIVQALRGMSMMGLDSKKAAEYFQPVNSIENNESEWCEEYDAKIKRLKDYIVKHKGFTEETMRILDIINSIKPQYHWKPTEEQLMALRDAIDNDELKLLYEQLKKL